jgi:hypothetical protein
MTVTSLGALSFQNQHLKLLKAAAVLVQAAAAGAMNLNEAQEAAALKFLPARAASSRMTMTPPAAAAALLHKDMKCGCPRRKAGPKKSKQEQQQQQQQSQTGAGGAANQKTKEGRN